MKNTLKLSLFLCFLALSLPGTLGAQDSGSDEENPSLPSSTLDTEKHDLVIVPEGESYSAGSHAICSSDSRPCPLSHGTDRGRPQVCMATEELCPKIIPVGRSALCTFNAKTCLPSDQETLPGKSGIFCVDPDEQCPSGTRPLSSEN